MHFVKELSNYINMSQTILTFKKFEILYTVNLKKKKKIYYNLDKQVQQDNWDDFHFSLFVRIITLTNKYNKIISLVGKKEYYNLFFH